MENNLKKLISIVIPAYNERDNIDALVERLQGMFSVNSAYDFEAIIVENGSQDDSYELLLAANQRDARFKVIQLARNFRMDGGLTAGLNHAQGDAAVLMTADLQDPPEVITEFIKKWEEGYENVYGITTKRVGTSVLRKINSALFYFIANKLTGGMIPRNASDFRLVDRRVYRVIIQMEERNRFLRGLFAWVGFKSIGVRHERAPRVAGVSGAHTFKVIELALKGIFAHSYIPLKLVSLGGLTLTALGTLGVLGMIARSLMLGHPFAGFGGLIAVLVFLAGLVILCLGIVAEYIGLIYEEVKARPNYVISRAVGVDVSQTAR